MTQRFSRGRLAGSHTNTEVKQPRTRSGGGRLTSLLRNTSYRWLEQIGGFESLCNSFVLLVNCSSVQVSGGTYMTGQVTPSFRMGRKADGPLGTFRQE